ncbi:zf-HC2 domain-containing protein [Clostridium sp. P21]|uniref:Anti-sigma-W factor RsiW n=1 Tax=Clostridium muellerianum TaxID=2716538 RepID=A0A7Y0EJ53_9CLOT|nr:zf-HC2 domain-containing protein [Clostridium muellerianum]NMM63355.1 zf-HC2 domain-containing protein [Clostridium muellerianum]
MSCKLDKKFLYAYADNTIDPLEKIFVEEHLKHCDECIKTLELIHNIDKNLSTIDDDFIFPERLSLISELVAENCISKVEEKDFKLKITNMYRCYKTFKKNIKKPRKLYKQNLFNKFINKNIDKSIKFIEKPIKKAITKKIRKVKIFNLFNAS